MPRGSDSNGFPNTLQELRIAKKPRGIATHSWLKNKNFFIRGVREYVTENKVIRRIKTKNTIWTVRARRNAPVYNKKESLKASFDVTIPCGIGR
jgi:hypothetical protein